jgi:hypothetical protein
MNSCLAAQIRFMLFKGPGSFKKFFKIGRNVDDLKAYRLIQLTPPLFFHFTLPLNKETASENDGSSSPKLSRYKILPVRRHKSTHLRVSSSPMCFQLCPTGQGHVTDRAGMPRRSMLTGHVLL